MQKASTVALSLIQLSESLEYKAYKKSDNVWTIGYGTTFYPNGSKVKQGDVCSKPQAQYYLENHLETLGHQVSDLVTKVNLNQNQFDALIDFAYNLGIEALKDSTLLKKIIANPNDPSIATEFSKWTHCKGEVLPGLVKRRKKEADLYFKAL